MSTEDENQLPEPPPILLPRKLEGLRIKQLQHRTGSYLLQFEDQAYCPERQQAVCPPNELSIWTSAVAKSKQWSSVEEQLKHHHHCAVNSHWELGSDCWQSEFSGCYRGESLPNPAIIEPDLYKSHIFYKSDDISKSPKSVALSSSIANLAQMQPVGAIINQGGLVAERYPRPSACRKPSSLNSTAPWHAHWNPSAVASLIKGSQWDSDTEEQLGRHPQPPPPLVELQPDLARRRRRELLETHFGEKNEGVAILPVSTTFADAFGRDETVTQIRNVYDARRFLESDATEVVEPTVSTKLPAAAKVCRVDLKKSSWMPGEPTASAQSSTYRKDFRLDSYSRPYIQPPMGDSQPLPKIGGSRMTMGISRSAHHGEDFGLLIPQKAENDRVARVAAQFCFIGAGARGATRGANSADSGANRGRSVNLSDYGDFDSQAYRRQSRFPERIAYKGVAESFQYGITPQ